MKSEPFRNESFEFVNTDDGNPALLAALRSGLPGNLSWTATRKLLRARRVTIGGVLCLDEARRLSPGETIGLAKHPLPMPPSDEQVSIRHVDACLIVVEKPSGMITLRRKSEYGWSWERKNLHPTLDECVPRLVGQHAANKHGVDRKHRRMPRLFPVHRIDRDSSGLLVFARNEDAQTHLIQQFARHHAVRKYLAIVPGKLEDQTVKTQFIRDRGDGLRGSTDDTSIGEQAVTHIRTLRTFGPRSSELSELECTLETGRTNQIRIHLAELEHPICGDIKYRGRFGVQAIADDSGCYRLALHATTLRFKHPESEKQMQFETAWPADIQRFLDLNG